MQNEIQIRHALRADAVRVAALGAQVWLHTYATEGVSQAIARYVLDTFTEARIRALIEDPARQVLVAERGGNLLGYAVLGFGACYAGVRCEIETLYVQAHAAGRGIGRALLAQARTQARQRDGSAGVWLTVNARNEKAIGFYLAQGFIDEGEAWFELDGTRHLNRVMVLAECASDAL